MERVEGLGREHAGDLAPGARLDAALVQGRAVGPRHLGRELGGPALVGRARELDEVLDHVLAGLGARPRGAGTRGQQDRDRDRAAADRFPTVPPTRPATRQTTGSEFSEGLERRRRVGIAFAAVLFVATLFGLVVLVTLLIDVVVSGYAWLDWDFLTSYPSRRPERAGIKSAIVGSVYAIALTGAIAVPIGVASALYLEEYAPRHWFFRVVQINIANLAGVPSVLYGILGLAVFVRFMALERSLLAGALTMALLILPVIIIATQEALRSVPTGLRESAYALGATRWQVIWSHLLPTAAPGIMTGVILSLSRAIGETAPLIMIGALTFVAFLPESIMDTFTVLPIQIFNWTARPQPTFREIAAAGIVVLMVVLLLMNLSAILLRNRFEKMRG